MKPMTMFVIIPGDNNNGDFPRYDIMILLNNGDFLIIIKMGISPLWK